MVSLNEVAILMNQLSIIRRDSREEGYNGIIRVDVGTRNTVLLHPDAFLSEFLDYGVKVSDDIGFELTQHIFGVEFSTFVDVGKVIALKETMPEHHKYILQQVQTEVVQT